MGKEWRWRQEPARAGVLKTRLGPRPKGESPKALKDNSQNAPITKPQKQEAQSQKESLKIPQSLWCSSFYCPLLVPRSACWWETIGPIQVCTNGLQWKLGILPSDCRAFLEGAWCSWCPWWSPAVCLCHVGCETAARQSLPTDQASSCFLHMAHVHFFFTHVWQPGLRKFKTKLAPHNCAVRLSWIPQIVPEQHYSANKSSCLLVYTAAEVMLGKPGW